MIGTSSVTSEGSRSSSSSYGGADSDDLCGLLEKKNRFLGWSTRSVRLKEDYIEYSKRNGKTRIVKLRDVISVSAKGVEVEFIVLDENKQFKLKLRAENEILAYRWLQVVEAARRKQTLEGGKVAQFGSLKKSGSDTNLSKAAAPGLFKRQATAGDIPASVLLDDQHNTESSTVQVEGRTLEAKVNLNTESKNEKGNDATTHSMVEMNIVESPRTGSKSERVREREKIKGQQERQQIILKKSAVLPEVVGLFAKDLILVFVQPVVQVLQIFGVGVVNSLKKQQK